MYIENRSGLLCQLWVFYFLFKGSFLPFALLRSSCENTPFADPAGGTFNEVFFVRVCIVRCEQRWEIFEQLRWPLKISKWSSNDQLLFLVPHFDSQHSRNLGDLQYLNFILRSTAFRVPLSLSQLTQRPWRPTRLLFSSSCSTSVIRILTFLPIPPTNMFFFFLLQSAS